MKRNKIKSNLCRVCILFLSTVCFFKSCLSQHIFKNKGSATAVAHSLTSDGLKKINCKTLIIFFIFFLHSHFSQPLFGHWFLFLCILLRGYFGYFSSLWWSQPPGDFYYIIHNNSMRHIYFETKLSFYILLWIYHSYIFSFLCVHVHVHCPSIRFFCVFCLLRCCLLDCHCSFCKT